jgi:hypothetical protein
LLRRRAFLFARGQFGTRDSLGRVTTGSPCEVILQIALEHSPLPADPVCAQIAIGDQAMRRSHGHAQPGGEPLNREGLFGFGFYCWHLLCTPVYEFVTIVLDMKVQHPIQHALASFWAFVPDEDGLRITRDGRFKYVSGEYVARRQVFADYYRIKVEKGTEFAPHILFARSGDSIEDIRRFTSDWGPLQPNGPDDISLRMAFGGAVSPQNYFAFDIESWRFRQQQFAKAIRLVETNDLEALRRLVPYQHQSGNPVRTGALYPYFEIGSPIEILEELWTADGRMTKGDVRRTAKRCGIFFTEKGGPKYQMVFEAVSLMDAFWHMLLLDLTGCTPTRRICANAKCHQPFLRERSDQKYCGPECTRKAARLAYYHRTGAAKRRNNRERKNGERRRSLGSGKRRRKPLK